MLGLEIVEKESLSNGEKILLDNFYFLDETATKDLLPGGICPFLGREAWLSTKGKFSPCCAPNDQRKMLGEFGNLYHTSLEEIWKSKN